MRAEFSVILPDEKKGYLHTIYELHLNIGNEVFTQRATFNAYPSEHNPPSSFIKDDLTKRILEHIRAGIIKDIGRF